MTDFESKKILVVEDNPVNQKVLQKLVTILGHSAIILEDGFKAIETVMTESPDLILMDIQLVGISGIDITRQLKTDERFKSIPLIAVTASATVEDKEFIIRESMCDDYISKPFTPKGLAEKISRFITVKNIF